MINFWQNINSLVQSYNLNAGAFIVIYLFSFLPVYFGIFLIIHGSIKKVLWKDVLHFRLNRLRWNNEVKLGIVIHLVGLCIPYGYVIFFGRNLPPVLYFLISAIIFISLFYFLYKFKKGFNYVKLIQNKGDIFRKEIIDNVQEIERLWQIYNNSFIELNKKTPCRQSFNKRHFFEVLQDPTVLKYLMVIRATKEIAGIGLITNNFKNAPWISEEYFGAQFPEYFSRGLAYYFLGLAVDKTHRGQGYAIAIIEKIIEHLPQGAIMGFDHSYNVNPRLYYFIELVKQRRNIRKKIKRKCIDKQIYHIVYQK